MLQENFSLHNGVKIPKIGLGTWLIPDEEVDKAVLEAIKIGYRHIDTAQAYQNEAGVGRGIKQNKVNREELFITTKIDADIKSYDKARESIDDSLSALDLDFLDLMIIHSPKPWKEFRSDDRYFEGNLEVWKALEEAYEAGKIKAIGLSNFEKEDVKNILENGDVMPTVNQILAHIRNTPEELIEFCKQNNILVEAYSPIGHGKLLDDDELKEVAENYEVSVPQLCVRYALQLGLLPLPKSSDPEHIRANAQLDFSISEEDMEKLKSMKKIKDYGEAAKFPVFA